MIKMLETSAGLACSAWRRALMSVAPSAASSQRICAFAPHMGAGPSNATAQAFLGLIGRGKSNSTGTAASGGVRRAAAAVGRGRARRATHSRATGRATSHATRATAQRTSAVPRARASMPRAAEAMVSAALKHRRSGACADGLAATVGLSACDAAMTALVRRACRMRVGVDAPVMCARTARVRVHERRARLIALLCAITTPCARTISRRTGSCAGLSHHA